jgi:hypothetical protein
VGREHVKEKIENSINLLCYREVSMLITLPYKGRGNTKSIGNLITSLLKGCN